MTRVLPLVAFALLCLASPVNPNRVRLTYRVTLYYPPDAPTYLLRLRLFGNYE
jgi:hypothetical protein